MKNTAYISDMQNWMNEFSFSHQVTVRFSETDMFGHMNNTVPFVYFEESRIEFFKALGFMQDWTRASSSTIPVVADLQCDFLKQVYFGEKLEICVKANELGTSSVDLHYLGKRENGEPCFVGRGRMVQLNKHTGKGEAWSEEQRSLFLSPLSIKN
ncbi:acyl-CoA thioester hydrolase [Bacillus tianshenii]|uniref:Acyl-CoA thioester hydrolase n=1 Tax=Sutcliffiella tianshenii TaxID=1463404 RepID=A0ABS2P0M4_9BACI|nr:thioesterase family protein [Bacillus tianshenii]MBM7620504.1 acyl-CoA thioester hydrolase [Bacillus tianshenii]